MTTYRSVAELIACMQENQRILDTRARVLSTSLPSLDDGISEALLADEQATLARHAIVDACEDLSAVNKGPMGILSLPAHNLWSSLHVVVRFDLVAAIPTEGDEGRTFEQIAEDRNLDVSIVKRILKNVMTLYVFKEGPPGTIKHNAASRYLAKSSEMREWVGMVMEELWPAAANIAHAVERFPGSQEPHETAYGLAHDTSAGFFGFMGQHPARFQRFANAMTWFSSGPGLEASHLVDGYPWAEMSTEAGSGGKVVDVGGSFGAVSLAVAAAHPLLSFIIQDRPEVIEAGRQQVLLPEMQDRLEFQAHDFFTEQPVKDANVYLLRQICHDWSDKYAAKILAALVPALEKGRGKIVIMEQIVPGPGQVSLNLEQQIRSFDLAMLEISNGKERDMEDWKDLLARADPRLMLNRVFQPPGSKMGILEVVLQPSKSVDR